MNKTDSHRVPLESPLACVILAAGQGTRMRSDLPKVLHPVAGQPMIQHVLAVCQKLGAQKSVVVASPSNLDALTPAVAPTPCVVQEKPLGTGNAVKAAEPALREFKGDLVVLYGDVPLVTAEAIQSLRAKRHETGAALVVGGFTASLPHAYGRLVMNGTMLEANIEAKDATPDQREITFCNSGLVVFDAEKLWHLLGKLTNNNANKEYYLTDCVHLARAEGWTCAAVEIPNENAVGINTRVELAAAEKLMQQRLRTQAMLNGVTMTDPDTVYLSADTQFGRDIVIGPHVVIGAGVSIADHVTIHAFSHLTQATVGTGAQIGPYARLRPDAKIGADAHIGNFVEIKKATICDGAKVNHLTYIGDATVGAKANIGAGTITCNYDGYGKYHTEIGAGAFIGSNTSLVAPVEIGSGAITGAGSVITKNIPADALAVTRAPLSILETWAKRFRDKQAAKKG